MLITSVFTLVVLCLPSLLFCIRICPCALNLCAYSQLYATERPDVLRELCQRQRAALFGTAHDTRDRDRPPAQQALQPPLGRHWVHGLPSPFVHAGKRFAPGSIIQEQPSIFIKRVHPSPSKIMLRRRTSNQCSTSHLCLFSSFSQSLCFAYAVQHTALFDFPPQFLWLTDLQHLDLTHCGFKALPDRFGDLTGLEYVPRLLICTPPLFSFVFFVLSLSLSRAHAIHLRSGSVGAYAGVFCAFHAKLLVFAAYSCHGTEKARIWREPLGVLFVLTDCKHATMLSPGQRPWQVPQSQGEPGHGSPAIVVHAEEAQVLAATY